MKGNIHGIGNEGRYNYIVLNKEQKIIDFIEKVLKDLFQEEIHLEYFYTDEYQSIEEAREKKPGKKVKKKVEEIIDQRFNFSGEDYKIDLIFCKDKVFIIADISLDKRKELIQILKEMFKFNGE